MGYIPSWPPRWQEEIWSCYYCGSYNDNALYYCPHCNSRRKEDGRLNRQEPVDWSRGYAIDTPYFVKSGIQVFGIEETSVNGHPRRIVTTIHH